MAIFRSYAKSEDAYADAAFLAGMGLDPVVFDDRAVGGNLLGTPGLATRVELPDGQLAAARELFAGKTPPHSNNPVVGPVRESTQAPGLARWFRIILAGELICYGTVLLAGALYPAVPPPAVEDYLRTLSFSDVLWRFAVMSYWPNVLIGTLASVLCWFHSRLGRSLYAISIGWGLITQLGPPPQILSPALSFVVGIQGSLAVAALTLMYGSPLRVRFERD